MPADDTPTSHEAGPLQRGARLALVLFVLLLALVVLSPSSSGPDALLSSVADRLVAHGVTREAADVARLEVAANVAIVLPVGVLGALAFPRRRWQDWAAYAFLGALAVEVVQGALLPDREMAASDVVANTGGAVVGALVVAVFRRRRGALRD